MTSPIIRANNGQAFYCTVYEQLDSNGDVTTVEFENCASTSTALADFEFRRAHEFELIHRQMRVISTAPCVGAFIDDETGEVTL